MDTCAALRTALLDIMQTTPIDAASTQSVFECAGVSKQTFYRHYADKYALLEECFELLIMKPFEEGARTASITSIK